MAQNTGIASFICDSFYSVNTWFFFSSPKKTSTLEKLCESREKIDIFVSCILQPKVNDPLLSYYFKQRSFISQMEWAPFKSVF